MSAKLTFNMSDAKDRKILAFALEVYAEEENAVVKETTENAPMAPKEQPYQYQLVYEEKTGEVIKQGPIDLPVDPPVHLNNEIITSAEDFNNAVELVAEKIAKRKKKKKKKQRSSRRGIADLRESGKEVTKAAAELESQVGQKTTMSFHDRAKLAAEKRWAAERAKKATATKDFEKAKEEPIEDYHEHQSIDCRDIMEGNY